MATRHEIQDQMAKAIRWSTGARVEVTLRGDRDGEIHLTVSGQPADVDAAEPVLRAAGLLLDGQELDDELAEAFAYWHAPAGTRWRSIRATLPTYDEDACDRSLSTCVGSWPTTT